MVKLKDNLVIARSKKDTVTHDVMPLEKLIPKLPSSIIGMIFKTLPSKAQIEVGTSDSLILNSYSRKRII